MKLLFIYIWSLLQSGLGSAESMELCCITLPASQPVDYFILKALTSEHEAPRLATGDTHSKQCRKFMLDHVCATDCSPYEHKPIEEWLEPRTTSSAKWKSGCTVFAKLYIYIYLVIYICIQYIYTYIYIYTVSGLYIYIYKMCIYKHICVLYIHTCIYIYIYIHIYIYIYIIYKKYIYMYVIYVYILYIYINKYFPHPDGALNK